LIQGGQRSKDSADRLAKNQDRKKSGTDRGTGVDKISTATLF
jgi:hypothetical protein